MIRVATNNDLDIINCFLKEFNQPNISSEDIVNHPFSKYVLFEDKKIIGFMNYSIIYERVELNYIYVKKDYRKRKIGSELMEYLINDAKKNNAINITLEVREDNISALTLYKKYGFKKIRTIPNYYKNKNGILMLRELI